MAIKLLYCSFTSEIHFSWPSKYSQECHNRSQGKMLLRTLEKKQLHYSFVKNKAYFLKGNDFQYFFYTHFISILLCYWTNNIKSPCLSFTTLLKKSKVIKRNLIFFLYVTYKINIINHVYSWILVKEKESSLGFLPILCLSAIALTILVLPYPFLTTIELNSPPVTHNSPRHPSILYLIIWDFR